MLRSVTVLAVGSAALLVLNVRARKRQRQGRNLPPGETCQSEQEELAQQGSLAFYERKLREQGRQGSVVKAKLGSKFMAIVFGIENFKAVQALERDGRVGPGRSQGLKELLGSKSLVNLDGHAHKLARQKVLRALSPHVLASNITLMSARIDERIHQLANRPHPVDLHKEIYELVWGLMFEILCGESDPAISARARMHVERFSRGLSASPTSKRYQLALASRDWLHSFFRGMLASDRAGGSTLLRNLSEAVDEQGNPADEQAIVESATLIMFASVDTTTSLLLGLFRQFLAHPDILDKVTIEVEQFCSRHDKSGGPITLKRLEELTYLDAVVKETLAHDDPFASLFRETKQDVQLGGYTIPKGWILAIVMSRILRDALGEDNGFRPERWLDPESAKMIEKQGFQPWGSGSHTCPGARFPPAESKLLFVKIVQAYHIGVVELPTMWKHKPALLPFKGRFLVHLIPRTKPLGRP